MNFENIRYYFTVLLLVLGGSIFYTGVIVWVIKYFIPVEGKVLLAVYIVTYAILCFFSFRSLVKMLRGIV